MKKKAIDYKDILSMFLPKGMLDYFDFTHYSIGVIIISSPLKRKIVYQTIFKSPTSFQRFLSRDNSYRFSCSRPHCILKN